MRPILFFLSVLLALLPLSVSAKLVRDTVYTRQNDRIILTYDIAVDDDNVLVKMDRKPRIIPGDNLRKACKGDLGLLKVVVFDRVGNFGSVKWNGNTPKAFTVPAGLSYDRSGDGFYILGETPTPLSFSRKGTSCKELQLPLHIAIYEKKQTYRLVGSSSAPLKISVIKPTKTPRASSRRVHAGTETEQIAVQSIEEVEADNDEVTNALSTIQMVRRMLESETEFPFSQALQMEIFNLSSMKERIKDPDIVGKINEVLLLCKEKEAELKASQKDASLAAQSQEQALLAQQKAEEEARQKEEEEKARVQEEKQQKRTLWMIIGGVILAVLGFIGNAVFKHFRDIRNQKSIMEMQESLARQAEHEAGRRSREIVRNKAHQVVNKGKSKMRVTLQDRSKKKTRPDTGIKSDTKTKTNSKPNSNIKSI